MKPQEIIVLNKAIEFNPYYSQRQFYQSVLCSSLYFIAEE